MEEKNKNIESEKQNDGPCLKRRDLVKGLMTLPLLGAFGFAWHRKQIHNAVLKETLRNEISLDFTNPILMRNVTNNKQIRLGIIGSGGRGRSLLKAAGFIHPKVIDNYRNSAKKDKNDLRYEEYLEQDDLNVVLNGVCDIYDINAQKGMEAGANINRQGSEGIPGKMPKRYKNYKDLLAASDIDAVIIATPDHWHGPITIAAAKAGKHVYCEKPMTWTVPETYEVVQAVKDNNIVFQLGHQNRQTESFFKAKEAVEKNILGKINLIEVATNRNTPSGAWQYKIDPEAGPHNIDWKQFIGPAPWHEFSLERFFRWRCWWDYSTGLSGDLFTHDYDAMNQILDLGIPHSAVASGGIYFYKDGRTVPDVLQMAFEYPKKDLTLLYSATQSSSKPRGRAIMGHDAYMEIGHQMHIYPDRSSTKYKEQIENGTMDPKIPIYSYQPGMKQVDAITSPTERYFAGRGLLYTYLGGKRIDPSFLHIKDWLDCIRDGGLPSCNIHQGFEEAMTAHMGTIALKEKRQVFWNEDKQQIV